MISQPAGERSAHGPLAALGLGFGDTFPLALQHGFPLGLPHGADHANINLPVAVPVSRVRTDMDRTRRLTPFASSRDTIASKSPTTSPADRAWLW